MLGENNIKEVRKAVKTLKSLDKSVAKMTKTVEALTLTFDKYTSAVRKVLPNEEAADNE